MTPVIRLIRSLLMGVCFQALAGCVFGATAAAAVPQVPSVQAGTARVLVLPRPEREVDPGTPAPAGSLTAGVPAAGAPEAARRLFRAGRPIIGTLADSYLRARGITAKLDWPSLRYHPSVYYRAHEDAAREIWPALLAAVTDGAGLLTGRQRTWLDPIRRTKAPLSDPRRAMGHLLGNGVRFGANRDVLAAGEGVETMLALKSVLPHLPMIAALSANHLAALDLPARLTRLYVARDNDEAGRLAAANPSSPIRAL